MSQRPTRRTVMAGAASAALVSPVAVSKPSLDWALVALEPELDRIIAEVETTQEADDATHGAALDASYAVLEQIAGIPARTIQGARIKARALAWHAPEIEESPYLDKTLTWSLLQDLLNLPGGAA